MTLLTGQLPENTYGDLITTTNGGNGLPQTTPVAMQDGFGNNSPVSMSQSIINISRAGGKQFQLDGIALTSTATIINQVCQNNPILPGTGGVLLPSGTTGQRAGSAGTVRFNTTIPQFEATEDGVTWIPLAVAGGGISTVNGTANQIVSNQVGPVVTLGLANNISGISSIAPGNLGLSTNSIQSTNLNGTIDLSTNGNGPVRLINGTSAIPLQFWNAAATHYVALQAGNPGANVTWTLPTTDSTGTQGLVSNGAGVLSWSSTPGFTISGTVNQIDVTGSPNYVIAIDPNYVGQTSITTLGTIATGTWAGTNVALNHGGTNAALTASNGGIVWSNATQMQILAGTATANQALLSGSSATPAWSTATYPPTTTINQLLYSSAANTITGLATANSASLVTSSTGVPAWSGTMTNGQIIIGSTGATPTAATLTQGSGVTITNGAGSITISATGSGGTVTSVSGTAPIASTGGNTPVISLNGTTTAGQVLQSLTATTTQYSTATYPVTSTINQLLYSSSNNVIVGLATANSGVLVTSGAGVPSILAAGTTGQMLQASTAGTPAWSTTTYPATNAINTLLYASSANVMSALATGNNGILVTSGTGAPSIATTFGQGLAVSSSQLNVGGANNIPFNTGHGIQDNNGNSSLLFTVTASAVNYINITNNSTTNSPIVAATGSDTNVLLTLQGKGNSGCSIQGTTAAGNAAAGYVGEYVTSNVPFASAISLTTNTAANVTSISLTAGDWDVFGNVFLNPSGSCTALVGWTSTTSASSPDPSILNELTGSALGAYTAVAPYLRVNVSSTTTVYLSAKALFTTGAVTVSGTIYARRVR